MDRLIGSIMDQVKFSNGITLRHQTNSQFTLNVLRINIGNVIAKNSSESSDDDSVTPLEQPDAANANFEPLFIQTDANFRGNVRNVDIAGQFYHFSLQHLSDNESQYDDSLQSINRISSGP